MNLYIPLFLDVSSEKWKNHLSISFRLILILKNDKENNIYLIVLRRWKWLSRRFVRVQLGFKRDFQMTSP